MAHLGPGEVAGHEEADRADDVGTPDEPVLLADRPNVVEGEKRHHVEVDGADQLDRRGPPVDRSRPPVGQPEREVVDRPGLDGARAVGSLDEAQVRSAGEEDRTDEERQAVGSGRHGVEVRGQRTEREADRADGEQTRDPPRPAGNSHPAEHRSRSTRRHLQQPQALALAVPTRRPLDLDTIRPPIRGPGDERTRTFGSDQLPVRRGGRQQRLLGRHDPRFGHRRSLAACSDATLPLNRTFR